MFRTMYQKMGIDLNHSSGITKVLKLECDDIPDGKAHKVCDLMCGDCSACKANRLFAKEKAPRRFETIKTPEDLIKCFNDWVSDSDECDKCKEYDGSSSIPCVRCFMDYLLEYLIEEV